MNLEKHIEAYLLGIDFKKEKEDNKDYFIITNTGLEYGPISFFNTFGSWENIYIIVIETYDTRTEIIIKHWALSAIKTIEAKEL